MKLQKVKAVQDNDGHWFVIPCEQIDNFNHLLEWSQYESCMEWESNEEEFINTFSKYATGGDLNLVQLYADI